MSTGKKEVTAQVSPVDHRTGEGDLGRGSHDFRVSHLGEPDYLSAHLSQDHRPPLPLHGTRTQHQAAGAGGKSETGFYHSL